MKFCKKLKKLISEIDHDDCPNDCRKCEHCIDIDKLEKNVFPYWKD